MKNSGAVFGLLHALKRVADDIGISSAPGKTDMGRLALFLVLAEQKQWLTLHKLTNFAELKLEERKIVETVNAEAKRKSLELAGCYVLVSDVAKENLITEQIHENYMALQKVQRDSRTMKTGRLEIRPVFVRKESRTRGHVLCAMLALLKLQREV